MNAQEVITMAANSELSNINIKDDVPTVIGYMNLGIIELYKRFALSTKEHVITLLDGVEIYDMPTDFMWAIEAYGEADVNSVIKVNKISINDEDDELGINTINWRQVQVPIATTGSFISIIYAASPVLVTELTINDPLPLPIQMIEPLLNYIGYKGNTPTDSVEENNMYYRRFELSCKRIEDKGMFTADSLNTTKFKDRGFA